MKNLHKKSPYCSSSYQLETVKAERAEDKG